MSSHILKLRSYLNNPQRLDFNQDLVELDDGELPTLLILDVQLAHELLKSPHCATYNLVDYWKIVTRSASQPALERLFRETPFFLHGDQHREINRQLSKPYRRIEAQLPLWLPDFTADYLVQLADSGSTSGFWAIAEYIRQLFAQLLAREFAVEADQVPSFNAAASLVLMFQSHDNLCYFDSVVHELYRFGTAALSAQGRDQSELSALLSVAMMGREPLFAAILYALMEPPVDGEWDAKAVLRDSAPVAILGRQMLEDAHIAGYSFRRGQVINIATFLVRPKSAQGCPLNGQRPSAKQSLEFGAGPHLCSGRAISIAIVEIFLAQWQRSGITDLDFSKTRLYRDFITIPKEK